MNRWLFFIIRCFSYISLMITIGIIFIDRLKAERMGELALFLCFWDFILVMLAQKPQNTPDKLSE